MAKIILVITLTVICLVSKILAKSIVIDNTGINNANINASLNTTMNQEDRKALDINLMEIMNECNESFRIEMSYIDALNKSGSFPDEVDKTAQCYVRCVFEKAGIESEDDFDAERAAMIFAGNRVGQEMDDFQEIAELCGNRHESCKCEKAYNFLKCLMTFEISKNEENK